MKGLGFLFSQEQENTFFYFSVNVEFLALGFELNQSKLYMFLTSCVCQADMQRLKKQTKNNFNILIEMMGQKNI